MALDGARTAEQRISQLEQALGERRKELEALYALSELIAERGDFLDGVFRGVVELIPPSWQRPARTAARILFEDLEFRDPRFQEDCPTQISVIQRDGEEVGRIEVTLTQPPPPGTAPFLPEEQALLDVIAERLGGVAVACRREQRLRASEQRFRAAIDAFPSAFALYDRDRRIRFINASGVVATGRREEEILGRRDDEIFPEPVLRQLRPILERTYATGAPQQGEVHAALPTGEYDLLVHYTPLRDETGALDQVMAATWDVTEQRRREREQREIETRMRDHQRLESLGLLAGGVAHDFNNLLTIILGNTAELRTVEQKDQEALDHIEQAAEQAADLARQMMAYGGRRPLRRERLDLRTLVRDFTGLLRGAAGRSIGLDLALPEAPLFLEADSAQIRQVIMNLVLNAADAIGAGAGTVRIEAARRRLGRDALRDQRVYGEPGTGERVVITVSDDGVGMDADTLERILDPFFTTKSDGHGLGLAAVMGIVKGHDGSLAVSSTPGVGTRFQVVLPPAPEAATRPEPEVRARGEAGPRRGGRILVVDDEPGVRRVVANRLAAVGLEVERAAGGHEAVERVRSGPAPPDLVVLDLTMPGMNGAETWAALRALRPGLAVVFMSGLEDGSLLPEADRGWPLLAKPFRMREMVETVARVLDGADPAPEA